MKNLTAQELKIMFDDIWTARQTEKEKTGKVNEVREEILRKIYEAQKEVN